MIRLQDWELYEDDEITQAGQALKVMANSGQLVNISVERNMKRVFAIFCKEEVPNQIKLQILETFIIMAKNIGLRRIFMTDLILSKLMEHSLEFLDSENPKKMLGFQVI